MGVATAPAIRYAVSIQDDVLYEISKSLMMSRIAGNNIVSPYIVIRMVDPRIASVIHAEDLIFLSPSDNTGFECDRDDRCWCSLGVSASMFPTPCSSFFN